MSCCPIKLACLKTFPEGEAEELLTNQIVELDRQIAATEQELKDEIADNPRNMIGRSMRANAIKLRMLQNIIDGRVQSVSLDQFDIKPSRIAELTIAVNRLKASRAEISLLLEGLLPTSGNAAEPVPPVEEVLLSEEQIINQLKAQLASLEALKLENK